MDSISNAVRQLVGKSIENYSVVIHEDCVCAKWNKFTMCYPLTIEWEAPHVECHFIGPQYSADLLDIYKNAQYAIGKKLKLYSPWANADPGFIEKELDIKETKVDFLIPALHSYSQLTDALVNELVRRGIDLSKSDESVVIISEWDFFYGRTTQKSFAKSVQNYRKKLEIPKDKPWPEGVYSVSYMCGVDGKVPDIEVNTSAKHYTGSNRSREPDDYDKLITKFEQPQGQAQYDYIRRLPEKLQNIVPDASKIRAIGLFSVDIYDFVD